MNDRFTQIDEKLIAIDQKIETLACYAGDTTLLKKTGETLDKLAKVVREFHGQSLRQDEGKEWYSTKEAAIRLGYEEIYVTELCRNEADGLPKFLHGEKVDPSNPRSPWKVHVTAIEDYERKRIKLG